jgi:hypothetical protein
MLPSPSPQFTATAMWGPILAWSALELLAESINIEEPERAALDLFDRLRLREPFAQSFTALGFEGDEGWRVAARIKVVLLTGAGVGKPEAPPSEPEPTIKPESAAEIEPESPAKIEPEAATGTVGQGISPDTKPSKSGKPSGTEVHASQTAPETQTASPIAKGADSTPSTAMRQRENLPEPPQVSGHDFSRAENAPKDPGALAPEGTPAPDDEKLALAPALWRDPDVRWLTGVHEAKGHLYLVREQYEELLWWLLMPSLLRLAGDPTPSRDEVKELSKTVEEALATAKSANYRIDELLGAAAAPAGDESESTTPQDQSNTIEEGTAPSIDPVPEPPE